MLLRFTELYQGGFTITPVVEISHYLIQETESWPYIHYIWCGENTTTYLKKSGRLNCYIRCEVNDATKFKIVSLRLIFTFGFFYFNVLAIKLTEVQKIIN